MWKRTARYCFVFSNKLQEKGWTHFVTFFFPSKKKEAIFKTFRGSHKQTTWNTGMKLCVWIFYSILFHLKKIPFLHSHLMTHSLSSNTFCMWGRKMSPFVSCSLYLLMVAPTFIVRPPVLLLTCQEWILATLMQGNLCSSGYLQLKKWWPTFRMISLLLH